MANMQGAPNSQEEQKSALEQFGVDLTALAREGKLDPVIGRDAEIRCVSQVLTRRTNPTRHQMFRSGLQDYLEDTWPGGRAGFERDLVAAQPDLVVMGETVSRRWRASIQPDYVYVGSAPQWDWYARASLGGATIADLRVAAGFDPASPLAEPEVPSG